MKLIIGVVCWYPERVDDIKDGSIFCTEVYSAFCFLVTFLMSYLLIYVFLAGTINQVS